MQADLLQPPLILSLRLSKNPGRDLFGELRKRRALTRPGINDLDVPKGQVTPKSSHSGTVNTFSTASLAESQRT